MSDENVGGLPELPEPIDAIARNAWGPKPDYYTADQMHAYARAALSAHGQPVVDEAMVERAMDAFASVRVDPNSDTLDHDLMRAALTAALTGATP